MRKRKYVRTYVYLHTYLYSYIGVIYINLRCLCCIYLPSESESSWKLLFLRNYNIDKEKNPRNESRLCMMFVAHRA